MPTDIMYHWFMDKHQQSSGRHAHDLVKMASGGEGGLLARLSLTRLKTGRRDKPPDRSSSNQD